MSDWRLKLEEPEWALRERFIKVHSPLHNQEWCNALDLMLGMIADARDQAIAERDEARRALAECERERDALRSGTWAGAWKPVTGRPWSDHAWERHHPHGAAVLVCYDGEWRLMRRGVYVDFKTLAKESGADAAKAAADAHLEANGWWLDGGAHKAGEAK